MFLFKCISAGIILFLVPYLLGNLICYKDFSGILNTLSFRMVIGLFASLSLFWILCLPIAFLKIPFTVLVVLYSILLLILCGFSIGIHIHEKPWRRFSLKQAFAPVRSFEAIYLALFVVLLGIQLYFAAFYESTVWSYDDYDYVVRSLDTITSDHLFLHDTTTGNEVAFSFKRVLNSWDIYIAYLSKVTRFHVTTIAHTVIPVIFLLVAYMVYYYLAVQLFDQRENRWIFMSILSVAFMFGLYSPYSLTFRLLVTLWQGKAVLSAIIVPFMIGFLLICRQKIGNGFICIFW